MMLWANAGRYVGRTSPSRAESESDTSESETSSYSEDEEILNTIMFVVVRYAAQHPRATSRGPKTMSTIISRCVEGHALSLVLG